jgi:hypothetical protein
MKNRARTIEKYGTHLVTDAQHAADPPRSTPLSIIPQRHSFQPRESPVDQLQVNSTNSAKTRNFGVVRTVIRRTIKTNKLPFKSNMSARCG